MGKTSKDSYTFTLQLNITNVRNLRCRHCYHADHRPHGTLSFEDYTVILTRYLTLCRKWTVTPHLIICGGEPLLSRDLGKLCAWYDAHAPESEMTLLTNATLATPERIRSLQAYNIRMVQVSLDGATATTHDQIRGPGSFVRTMQGIRTLQQHNF